MRACLTPQKIDSGSSSTIPAFSLRILHSWACQQPSRVPASKTYSHQLVVVGDEKVLALQGIIRQYRDKNEGNDDSHGTPGRVSSCSTWLAPWTYSMMNSHDQLLRPPTFSMREVLPMSVTFLQTGGLGNTALTFQLRSGRRTRLKSCFHRTEWRSGAAAPHAYTSSSLQQRQPEEKEPR